MENKELDTTNMEQEMSETSDISGLFESTDDEIDMANIPKPEDAEDSVHKRVDINEVKSVDDLLDMCMEIDPDDDKHSNIFTIAMIQKLHGVTEDVTSVDDIPEENREYVDDIEISDFKLDIFALEGSVANVLMTFDSVHSAYLKELNELLNRYRIIQEDLAVNGKDDTVAMFSLIFMPKKMNGLASVQMNFPIMYARVLAENDVNCAMQLLFDINNIKFALLDIDEDTDAEITADAMRDAESGTGGILFDI